MATEIKLTAHQMKSVMFFTACLAICWLGLTGLIFVSWWALALFVALAALNFALLFDLQKSSSGKTKTLGITESIMKKNLQREAYEAFVRSGASPVPRGIQEWTEVKENPQYPSLKE